MNFGDDKISSLQNKQKVVKRKGADHLSPKQFREELGTG